MPDDRSTSDASEADATIPVTDQTVADDAPEHRTRLGLTTGSKVCILIALGLLLTAAYFFWAPLSVPSGNGPFVCQTAASPPGDDFAQSICSTITDRYLLRAALTAAAAVTVTVAGLALFGFTRRTVAATDPAATP